MALKTQAFWGDVPFIIKIKHICWTATMKAQEHLETSVIASICHSEGHNMSDYLSPRQNRCENLRSHNNGFISAFPISLHSGVSSLKEQKSNVRCRCNT